MSTSPCTALLSPCAFLGLKFLAQKWPYLGLLMVGSCLSEATPGGDVRWCEADADMP